MNKRIVKPLLQFVGGGAEPGTYMCDFQFQHINYANHDIACCVNAGIDRNATIFIIEVE